MYNGRECSARRGWIACGAGGTLNRRIKRGCESGIPRQIGQRGRLVR